MLLANNISFVSDVILRNLPIKRKKSATGYLNVDCPMCYLNGHRPDRKMRCGVMINPTSVSITCFNCGYKTGFTLGQTLSRKFRDFLGEIGVSDIDIKRLNHVAFTFRHMLEGAGIEVEANRSVFVPKFDQVKLPPGARSFEALAVDGCMDRDFLDAVEYLYSRGDDIADATTFYWTPDTKHEMNRRVIIPFYHQERIVGYTARAIDKDESRRYQMNSQIGYLFNNHVMERRQRAFVLLVEGPMDALAIDGVATLGARLNAEQTHWIKSTGKKIIVVPDRDTSGDKMIDIALANNWGVAFPGQYWDPDVKDTAEAVRRYGRLYTLTSIVRTAVDDNARISVYRKLLK